MNPEMGDEIVVKRRLGKADMVFVYEHNEHFGEGFFNHGRKHLYKLVFERGGNNFMPIWIALCTREPDPEGVIRSYRLGFHNQLAAEVVEFTCGRYYFQ